MQTPKYKNDILEHLCHVDAIPLAFLTISDYFDGIKQSIWRASYEIEKLRKENKKLKKKISKIMKKHAN